MSLIKILTRSTFGTQNVDNQGCDMLLLLWKAVEIVEALRVYRAALSRRPDLRSKCL